MATRRGVISTKRVANSTTFQKTAGITSSSSTASLLVLIRPRNYWWTNRSQTNFFASTVPSVPKDEGIVSSNGFMNLTSRGSSDVTGSSNNNNNGESLPDEVAQLVQEYSQKLQTSASLQTLTRTGRGEMLHKQQQQSSNNATATEQILIQVANFLKHELPIRLARRIQDLHRVPNLNSMPSVQLTKDVYLSSFLTLINDDEVIDTPVKEALFARKLELLYERHSTVLVTMAKGAYELRHNLQKQQLNDDSSSTTISGGASFEHMDECHAFLDRFYMSRIGIRVLAGQYLALRNPPINEFYVGLIYQRTSPYEIVQQAIKDATYMCQRMYGESSSSSNTYYYGNGGNNGFMPPKVIVKGRLDLTFPYIPTQLHYILLELLKNAMRATVEHHSDILTSQTKSLSKKKVLSPLSNYQASNLFSSMKEDQQQQQRQYFPPIEVIIADGHDNEDVVIKVADEGGGIPRSNMKKIWSYLFTTADPSIQDGLVGGRKQKRQQQHDEEEEDEEDHSVEAPLAGLGYGLPISRSYARYFGGDVSIMSMEGYGTDAFVYLKRLGDSREPLPV